MKELADEILLRALDRQWKLIQYTQRLPLRPPCLALHEGTAKLGFWSVADRTISLSRTHCLEDSWLNVSETLLHEVAHQYVTEVLGGEERPHGPLFQRTLKRFGSLPLTDGEEPAVVGRVRKLLALAGSPNRHEAELAMAKAQKLMLRNRIDSARLDGAEGLVRRQLGEGALRHPRWHGILVSVLSTQFFVKVIRASVFLPHRKSWGSAYEIAGRIEDVEMVSYAYTFVTRTSERLWKTHLAANPGVGRARARFLLGVVMGFAAKLKATTEQAEKEGLVWVSDPALDEAWARRYPRTTSHKGTYTADEHFYAGQSAGNDLVLHRPIQDSSGKGGLLEG